MAAIAGATELGGGLLTGAGIADPLGPLAIIGAMSVASATHRANGPLAAKRGFELPLTNLAAAAALAAAGPGRFRLGPPLPRALTVIAAVTGGALAAGSLAKLLTARPAAGQAGAAQPAAETRPGRPARPAVRRRLSEEGIREPRHPVAQRPAARSCHRPAPSRAPHRPLTSTGRPGQRPGTLRTGCAWVSRVTSSSARPPRAAGRRSTPTTANTSSPRHPAPRLAGQPGRFPPDRGPGRCPHDRQPSGSH